MATFKAFVWFSYNVSNYQYVETYRDIYPCTTNPPNFDPWKNKYMGTRKIAMHIKPGCIILINSISSKTWVIIRRLK